MSRKVSQPVLRAIKSIRNFRLPHSNSEPSDVALPTSECLGEDKTTVHRPLQAATPVPASRRNSQQASQLLALPQEIRDEIYAHVFYSTRLTMGRRITCAPTGPSSSTHTQCHHSQNYQHVPNSQGETVQVAQNTFCDHAGSRIITHVKPARHTMALFLVCRQITRELVRDNAWIGQVLFNFEDAATMLDVLGGIFSSPEQRSLIREVRVREGGLFVHQQLPAPPLVRSPIFASGVSSPYSFRSPAEPIRQRFPLLGGLMRLLPGLCLNRLTILPALPCRIHKSTRCHNLPGVDAYHTHMANHPPPPARLAAPHEILAELLYAGSGWKELCYVHHDTAMLLADKRRPTSLEAMMINMGFWDADGDTYEEVFVAAEQSEHETEATDDNAKCLQLISEDKERKEGRGNPFMSHYQHRHACHLGNLQAAFAARKEYRLTQWRRLLNGRDGWIPAGSGADAARHATSNAATTKARWDVSIDALIHKRFGEGDLPRSSVSVYGVRGGQALWPMETLEDVHESRIRDEDFMVVVRRGDNDEAEAVSKTKRAVTQSNSKAFWAETIGNPYPFREGDPRVLEYGSRWETLRPLIFPWDHLPATQYRRDRYRHRDEYVVRSQRRSA
ncbi:hypothetical protein SEPCBS57363_001180 [Sporothrix epigloea]|uniref:F-box domain containing protein n=1 Tax=Sporothrix epigloea TaxID=1892477 RepID=A0ABP0DB97_9PEZI